VQLSEVSSSECFELCEARMEKKLPLSFKHGTRILPSLIGRGHCLSILRLKEYNSLLLYRVIILEQR